MTEADFIRLVRSASYKRNVSIEIRSWNRDSITIVLLYMVPNSKTPEQENTLVCHNNNLPTHYLEHLDTESAKQLIFDMIVRAESHEAMEFLRFGGEQWRDPHA